MSYRLKRREPVAQGIRRIAREQASRAIAASGPVDDRVHDARTTCKKLRGLLRLVRLHFGGTFEFENAFLRDAARALSGARDATVVLDTFDSLANRGGLDPATRDAVRSALAPDRRPSADPSELHEDFAKAMREFRDRIEGWPVDASGFRALEDGLSETYRRGRRAMRRALATNDDADRHEWRKRVKDHGYHVRLLSNVWKPVMEARRRELERLGDLLGDDHDLAVLQDIVRGSRGLASGQAESVTVLVAHRRHELLVDARAVGERVFAEKPRAFMDRIRRYWNVWRS